MVRWKLFLSKTSLRLFLTSLIPALLWSGIAYAQIPDQGHYITMSERLGRFIVLFRAFDVWIYFFQGLLLFIGLGFTIYYFILFHRPAFIADLRRKFTRLSETVDPQAAIDFEVNSLSNKFLFLEMMIAAAPVSGLLGTVVGLVQVFSEQTVVEQVTMQSIAGGMYVAMVTTVCGLVVALIGIIGRHFLNARLAELRDMLAGTR